MSFVTMDHGDKTIDPWFNFYRKKVRAAIHTLGFGEPETIKSDGFLWEWDNNLLLRAVKFERSF